MTSSEVYDVIVVGCGASGIAALSKLHQNGLKVLGLEAADRIGGRIHSVECGTGFIDLGAEWCHGKKDNIVYDLVKDLKILREPKGDFEITFFDSSGEKVPQDISKIFTSIYEKIASTLYTSMVDSDRPLGEHFIEEFWNIIKNEHPNIDHKLCDGVLNWFHKFENSINASDTWYDASGKGHLEYWECEGNPQLHWNGHGFKIVLDILLGRYPDPIKKLPVKILLNKEVEKIIWDGGVNNLVEIQCQNGNTFTSKHVIVTVSVGVLQKRHLMMFQPTLPPEKANCISNIPIGTVNKMILGFDKPWWNEGGLWFGFVWKEEDKKTLKQDDEWLTEVFGFNSSFHNPNVLCGWISGSAGRYMETLPIDKVKDGLYRLLKIFLKDKYEIPPPLFIKRTTWYQNPLTIGSYTFRSMKTETTGASAEGLSAPMYNTVGAPALCFAGEATSHHYFSTVHGAIEAGFREADRIIDYQQSRFVSSKL